MASSDGPTGRRARIGFGAADLAIGAAVAVGVFRLLPARFWPVDVGGVAISAALVASGLALLLRWRRAEDLARLAAVLVLGIGLVLVGLLAVTASWLVGVYEPLGKGGAILFALIALLVLPYLVVFPLAQLLWVGPRAPRTPDDAA